MRRPKGHGVEEATEDIKPAPLPAVRAALAAVRRALLHRLRSPDRAAARKCRGRAAGLCGDTDSRLAGDRGVDRAGDVEAVLGGLFWQGGALMTAAELVAGVSPGGADVRLAEGKLVVTPGSLLIDSDRVARGTYKTAMIDLLRAGPVGQSVGPCVSCGKLSWTRERTWHRGHRDDGDHGDHDVHQHD